MTEETRFCPIESDHVIIPMDLRKSRNSSKLEITITPKVLKRLLR